MTTRDQIVEVSCVSCAGKALSQLASSSSSAYFGDCEYPDGNFPGQTIFV